MNLKQLARAHTVGGLTWHLTPYTTVRYQATRDQFSKVMPLAEWGDVEYSFVFIEAYTVAVDFSEQLTPEEQRFAQYWSSRPASIAERWTAFSFLIDIDITSAYWQAHGATRETVIENTEPIPEGERPNSLPASEAT